MISFLIITHPALFREGISRWEPPVAGAVALISFAVGAAVAALAVSHALREALRRRTSERTRESTQLYLVRTRRCNEGASQHRLGDEDSGGQRPHD